MADWHSIENKGKGESKNLYVSEALKGFYSNCLSLDLCLSLYESYKCKERKNKNNSLTWKSWEIQYFYFIIPRSTENHKISIHWYWFIENSTPLKATDNHPPSGYPPVFFKENANNTGNSMFFSLGVSRGFLSYCKRRQQKKS